MSADTNEPSAHGPSQEQVELRQRAVAALERASLSSKSGDKTGARRWKRRADAIELKIAETILRSCL